MGDVLADLARWTGDVVYSFGYLGVAALVALQNLFPPVPSALILPLAGFLVGQGRFSFFSVLLAATTGSVSSALVFYTLGRQIGQERLRKLVGRFGRFALVEESTWTRRSVGSNGTVVRSSCLGASFRGLEHSFRSPLASRACRCCGL